MRRLLPFGLALAAVLSFSGCGASGPRTYEVSGTVTVDGNQPLQEGEILFEPEHTYGPDHGLIKDGQFQVRVKEGKHKVRIIASRPVPGTKDMYGRPLKRNYIDSRFNDQTSLVREVGEGQTTFAFAVQSRK